MGVIIVNAMGLRDAYGAARVTKLHVLLFGIVGLIILGTSAATMYLWPESEQVSQQVDDAQADAEIVTARVSSINPTSCMQIGNPSSHQVAGEEQAPQSDEDTCLVVRAQLPIGKTVTFTLDNLRTNNQSLKVGDSVKLVAQEFNTGDVIETMYSFYDHPRGAKMLTVAILFALIVIAVGRLRGALALIGVGAAIVLLVTFILPAILAGKPAIPVAITGAIGIMVIVLYLAHGISHRTTAALFGSIFGILFTAISGSLVTHWLRFTGVASTEDASLLMAAPGLRMNDVLTATIVIAGLGILNDITVAQASAVWEMRALNPHLSKRRIYLSAMRVGRDHIASSIYTLVFAYAGAMLGILLLLYTYPRDLIDLVTTEHIGQEIIRTLIGAAGLVLSMPVTTGFAVLFTAPASRPLPKETVALE